MPPWLGHTHSRWPHSMQRGRPERSVSARSASPRPALNAYRERSLRYCISSLTRAMEQRPRHGEIGHEHHARRGRRRAEDAAWGRDCHEPLRAEPRSPWSPAMVHERNEEQRGPGWGLRGPRARARPWGERWRCARETATGMSVEGGPPLLACPSNRLRV